MNAPTVTLNTEIPETAAASAFPPTAYRFLPKVVLFQMNHTMATAAIAQRMMVGNPLTLGIIMLGMAESMAPKETPLVAYVVRPKMISMLAMVEMNGCILNLAVKQPAMVVKKVQNMIHITRAKRIFTGVGRPEKSKIWPKTEPVLIP